MEAIAHTMATSSAPINDSKANKILPPVAAATGFVLMDSSLSPVSFNAEAVQILSYPEKPGALTRLDAFLADNIRARLLNREPSHPSLFVAEFKSGKRRYLCRAFALNPHAKGRSHPNVALLFERSLSSGWLPLSPVLDQFHLTRRERQAVELLLQGLTSKEIADRMKISPNTVKAFLRLIMIKMGASTRSAIVAKIVAATKH